MRVIGFKPGEKISMTRQDLLHFLCTLHNLLYAATDIVFSAFLEKRRDVKCIHLKSNRLTDVSVTHP